MLGMLVQLVINVFVLGQAYRLVLSVTVTEQGSASMHTGRFRTYPITVCLSLPHYPFPHFASRIAVLVESPQLINAC